MEEQRFKPGVGHLFWERAQYDHTDRTPWSLPNQYMTVSEFGKESSELHKLVSVTQLKPHVGGLGKVGKNKEVLKNWKSQWIWRTELEWFEEKKKLE